MQTQEAALLDSPPDISSAVELSQQERQVLKQFHQQITALGALWILIGVLTTSAGLYFSFSGDPRLQLIFPTTVLIMVGCAWLALGVLTCLKKMPALTIALVCSYVMVGVSIVNGGGPGALLVLGIFQGHRVRGLAKKLAAAGLALTTKP